MSSSSAISSSSTTSSSSSSTDVCTWHPAFAGKVLFGTAGWTDASLLKCGLFYPSSVHTAADRLAHYSAHFPFVEVDSSNYAIPPVARVQEWLKATPPHFIFHFKIFSLFTQLSCRSDAYPGRLRDSVPTECVQNFVVTLSALPVQCVQALWQYWNDMCLPVHVANKLGLILFQFFFPCSDENKAHIRACRQGLDRRFRMGVEFRSRTWTTDEAELARTKEFLSELNITFVGEDDLEQEVRGAREIPSASSLSARLPIHAELTSTHACYIRLHRRVGDNRGDRVLHEHEFVAYRQLFLDLLTRDQQQPKRTYFLSIGTDAHDDPITNWKRFNQALQGTPVFLDWPQLLSSIPRKDGQQTLTAMFTQQKVLSVKKRKHEQQELDESTDELAVPAARSLPSTVSSPSSSPPAKKASSSKSGNASKSIESFFIKEPKSKS